MNIRRKIKEDNQRDQYKLVAKRQKRWSQKIAVEHDVDTKERQQYVYDVTVYV